MQSGLPCLLLRGALSLKSVGMAGQSGTQRDTGRAALVSTGALHRAGGSQVNRTSPCLPEARPPLFMALFPHTPEVLLPQHLLKATTSDSPVVVGGREVTGVVGDGEGWGHSVRGGHCCEGPWGAALGLRPEQESVLGRGRRRNQPQGGPAAGVGSGNPRL